MSHPPQPEQPETAGTSDGSGVRRHGAPLPHATEAHRDDAIVVRPSADADGKSSTFDLPATLGGAMAALGTFVLLSSLVGAIVGSIGYQTGVEGQEASIAGFIAGLVVLVLACLFGGWVAGRLARRKGGLHGLVAIAWLVLLAALLAALAALAGSRFDVTERIGLPSWFSSDSLGIAALISGLVTLLLSLAAGWFGGRLGEKSAHRSRVATDVQVVETRHGVRRRAGGIGGAEGGNR